MNHGTHVSRYKQWEVLPKHKWSGKWFKLAVGNDVLQSYILGENVSQDVVNDAERRGYQVIDVPLELKHDFELDLNRALIDFAGIAIQSAYKYIQYTLLANTFNKGNVNPFKKDILEIGMYDLMKIKDFFIPELVPESLYSKKIYIHCDLSKNGDRTGISAVAVLGYKDQNRYNTEGNESQIKEMIYRHIFTTGIEAPPNSEISFQKIRDFLHYLKYDLGWNIVGVSFDGYNSVDMRQQMELDGFKATIISLDRDDKGYSVFRNALAEKRISIIDINELTKEITALERNATTGKIDHPPQCLVGETKIRMIDGTSKTILQLMQDKFNKIDNYVYVYNENTRQIESRIIKNVWETGVRNDVYKITLSNNTYILCTSNHPFLLNSGNYIWANELIEGQQLMSLATDKKISVVNKEKLNKYYEVYDLEIEDIHNYALDTGVFVHNSIKKEDGKVIKSTGKDLVDSLCGSVYNASISVDINELDYMDGITLYDTSVTLSGNQNVADQYFGFTSNKMTGGIQFMEDEEQMNNEQAIQNVILKEINTLQNVIGKIKDDNPNTQLTNQQIKDLYEDFSGDDFLIF